MMSEDGYTKEIPFDFPRNPLCIFLSDFRSVFKFDELGLEIARIALPAALALTADPIASLVDTAFIGQIGPVELAAVGVSIALFNQVSRIAIFPLVSITTSFVAEEDACSSEENTNQDYKECIETGINNTKEETQELIPGNISTPDESKNSCSIFSVSESPVKKRNIPSASSALIIGAILGLLQAVFLISSAKPLLSFMGVKHDSPMLGPAQRYLSLRSLGAPAVLLSLATQGVFRGFKDTTTPLYATVIGDVTNIILDPIFIFVFRLGVTGAATAHVISQYLMCGILLWKLMGQVDIFKMSTKHLQFCRFMKNAAREGPTSMAAFQVCLQVWLATSLLADGFAVAGQAILASAFAKKDYKRAAATASRVLQLGLVLGFLLAVILGTGLHFGARLFTKDDKVLHLISIGLPFVAGTQPINALAFVFDGVNFGASDFGYAAASLVMVAIVSVLCLVLLSATHGFIGLWFGLTIYMSLRAAVGFWRIGTATGPWSFLRR
ncbi:protein DETOXIFICATION 42 isoform X2 [Brassica rapa]|uniref:protein DETOXIFICATION 42 isoform X2 n=1 Tax=Brassica campestris TaxID=3711 RepID=UPI0004F194A8|nr:protein DETOXIFICATION 42 isoform X2 [Brassica rapa]XP_048635481.1 protein DETOXIFICATION 42 isoform X2 [Brassica napus]XP_048636963.1 protein DETOXIFICATION 42-like isoform X2 [Brassica napus]